ncbi:MAG TPA: hypothetical protein VKU84_07910 [Stellaceae bacterium]|nr:hypothetical protein [Stellaceae bacterium]
MGERQSSKKAKLPRSVLRGLSRDLAAFGPDLRVEPKVLGLARRDQLTGAAGKPGKRQASTTRMLLSFDTDPEAASWWDRKRDALLKRATELRDKYRNNPYIEVKGFSIEIGISPSLTIDFEFK